MTTYTRFHPSGRDGARFPDFSVLYQEAGMTLVAKAVRVGTASPSTRIWPSSAMVPEREVLAVREAGAPDVRGIPGRSTPNPGRSTIMRKGRVYRRIWKSGASAT